MTIQSSTPKRRQVTGMTLIEMVIGLAVSAILIGLAAPSMQSFVQNNRISTATNDLHRAIISARSEAINRGVTIIMCRTGDPHNANPVCKQDTPGGNSNANYDWTYGWLMYALPTGSLSGRDYNSSTDTLLAVAQPSPTGVTVTANVMGNNWLTFYGDGTLKEDGTSYYAVCDERGTDYGQLITVPVSGRTRVEAITDCTP